MDGTSNHPGISLGAPAWTDRIFHGLAFGGLYLIGAGLTAGGASALDTDAGRYFLAFGLVCLTVTEIARRAHRREITPGAITIEGDHLSIHHPPLFKEPLRIQLSEVRAAVTMTSTDRLQEMAERGEPDGRDDEDVTFAVFGQRGGPLENRVRGHLSPEDHFPFRQLGRDWHRPNVLILFATPVVAAVRRETEWGPRQREVLAGLAAHVLAPEHAKGVFAWAGLCARIHEEDLDVVEAINSGEIRSGEPDAVTMEEANTAFLWKAGWYAALGGILLPFISVWALPIAVLAWRARRFAHSIGMAAVALAVLAFEVALISSPPVEYSWRFALGIAVTLLPLAMGLVVLIQAFLRRAS